MRLAVTGTRHGLPYVAYVLDAWVKAFGNPERVILGGDLDDEGQCTSLGVDLQAKQWAHGRYAYVEHFANWPLVGNAAGPQRNQRMAESMRACDHCIALPDRASKGTWDCARKMERVGCVVHVIPFVSVCGAKPTLPFAMLLVEAPIEEPVDDPLTESTDYELCAGQCGRLLRPSGGRVVCERCVQTEGERLLVTARARPEGDPSE